MYGDDGTASIGGLPYQTVEYAVQQTAGITGTTVWIMPGTYNLTHGLTLSNQIALRGLNTQTCTLQMMGVTANTTLLTMGESCRVEDLSLKLTSSEHHSLVGIEFGGTSSQTSKLRTSVLTVDNSGATSTESSNVYGILCSGTGATGESVFSFNAIKGSTINVKSNGYGSKRGILVSGSNQVSTRDTNIYVATPGNTGSTGSYVGVETNDPSGIGSIQLRSTAVYATKQLVPATYTSSDISQTQPPSLTDPTYLASPGIQIGPGTDLVTKSAGTKPFSTYIYPTSIFYGLKGSLTSGIAGYLWPGTQQVSAGSFPDPTLPAAHYRIQQPTILSGISANSITAPAGTNTVTITVYRTPVGGVLTAITGYVLVFGGTDLNKFYYDSSQDFAAGDFLSVGVTYTTNNPLGTPNALTDLSIQVDMF